MPVPPDETSRVRDVYERRGTMLTRSDDGGFLLGDGRQWLGSHARGETLEVGIGAGRTLSWYAPEVRLTGLDISPRMLAAAQRRADSLGMSVSLVVGDAAALPFPTASFETVVFCLSLCTIPDDLAAVVEGARVLRPGGRLLALEHVRSPNGLVRLAERFWDPIAVRRTGDHLLRDPLDHVPAAGLDVEDLHRSRLGIIERLVARKSAPVQPPPGVP